MAKTRGVWGIDLGLNALKAIRVTEVDDSGQVTADAFDYIEYPKIIAYSDVDAPELIQEALKEFLSRNSVRGDKVVVSVPGQSGLARFIKLPPVESKKIPAIVQYEARQQIPFPLDEVIWDYQQMGGGAVEEGFALETEVGIFAMKRDQVYKALDPFTKAGIEVNVVQLTPLALYNFVVYDQMRDLPPPVDFDPEDPPESVVLLSLGCDTTDIVVTNGFRVWQRSVAIGGNHFTKALVKEFDLPFAKAEHLKRNATSADDPKAVFQAMRPIFNDLVTECQRSLNFFQNLDRNAKLSKIIGLGSVMKLPGIRTYLSQNLGFEVERLDKFATLNGPGVTESPIFKDHMLSFPVAYGLALQGITKTRTHTNLLPREIIKDRMIREKKPWAVASAAALLLGMAVSGIWSYWYPWNTVHVTKFQDAEAQAQSVKQTADGNKAMFDTSIQEFQTTDALGKHLVENAEARLLWLEMLQAINMCLPPYPETIPVQLPETASDVEKITQRHQINITAMESEWVDNLGAWWSMVQQLPHMREAAKTAAPTASTEGQPADGQPVDGQTPAPAAPTAPSGSGWVIRLTAHHYHNPRDLSDQGVAYIQKTLLSKLALNEVEFVDNGVLKTYPVGELGISFPVLIRDTGPQPFDPLNQPEPAPFGAGSSGGGMGREMGGPPSPMFNQPTIRPNMGLEGEGGGGVIPGRGAMPAPKAGDPEKLPLVRIDFQIEFCWKPTPEHQRPSNVPGMSAPAPDTTAGAPLNNTPAAPAADSQVPSPTAMLPPDDRNLARLQTPGVGGN